MGEEILGKVHITGGSVSQQIESIYLTLSTSYIREVDDKKITTTTYDLERVRLTEPFSVEPNEKEKFHFHLKCQLKHRLLLE